MTDPNRSTDLALTYLGVAVSFYDRLKMLGFLFVGVFTLVRKWFACLPRVFKGEINPDNLPTMYNNLEPY